MSTPLSGAGRFLIILGVCIVVAGIVIVVMERFGLPGRLPGDFVIRGRRWTLWIPLTTSLILSVVLTIILNIFRRH